MAVPNYGDKLSGREISGPSAWADYMRAQGRFTDFKAPDLMILTWQKSLFSWIKSRYAHISCSGFLGDLILLDGTRSHEKKAVEPRIGVAFGFGIGAPAAVFTMESLAALGCRRFLGLGTAGGLLERGELSLNERDRSLRIGDILLADRAFRDEGTSYHYLEDGERAEPDREALESLEILLSGEKQIFRKGGIWTTDAFFRETEEEVNHYLSRGALAVDMEGAALFACARARNLSMASLFVISDILTGEGWSPDFHHRNVSKTLRSLFTIITGFDR